MALRPGFVVDLQARALWGKPSPYPEQSKPFPGAAKPFRKHDHKTTLDTLKATSAASKAAVEAFNE